MVGEALGELTGDPWTDSAGVGGESGGATDDPFNGFVQFEKNEEESKLVPEKENKFKVLISKGTLVVV